MIGIKKIIFILSAVCLVLAASVTISRAQTTDTIKYNSSVVDASKPDTVKTDTPKTVSVKKDSAKADETKTPAQDSVSEDDLDYHLSKEEFMYYYGTDDSSRALIRMFFRKRAFYNLENYKSNDYLGPNGCCGSAAIVYFTGGLALVALGIRAGINCSIYTRQALLYALLDYENGYGIPDQFARKIRERDFVH